MKMPSAFKEADRAMLTGLLLELEHTVVGNAHLDATIGDLTGHGKDRPSHFEWDYSGRVSVPRLVNVYRPYTVSVDSARTLLTEDWFIEHMGEIRTKLVYVGDRHLPLGRWQVDLQHIDGGRLTSGCGSTLPLALSAAAIRVMLTRVVKFT